MRYIYIISLLFLTVSWQDSRYIMNSELRKIEFDYGTSTLTFEGERAIGAMMEDYKKIEKGDNHYFIKLVPMLSKEEFDGNSCLGLERYRSIEMYLKYKLELPPPYPLLYEDQEYAYEKVTKKDSFNTSIAYVFYKYRN